MTVPAVTLSRAATGGSDLWQTPEVVLERVRRVGDIGLDPCAAPGNPTGARAYCYPEHPHPLLRDGLAVTWAGAIDLAYVNPPYSQMKEWAAKAASEAALGTEIVSLVAARPDSRWFYELCWDSAQAVCFWKGRLKFVGAPNAAPFPSAVVYHGPRPWAFEAAFNDAGRVLRL